MQEIILTSKCVVSTQIINKAIEILAPNCTNNTILAIRHFIENKIEEIGTCVIYALSESAAPFMKQIGIDIGQKELIILPKVLLYSEDYRYKPQQILKVK